MLYETNSQIIRLSCKMINLTGHAVSIFSCETYFRRHSLMQQLYTNIRKKYFIWLCNETRLLASLIVDG